MLSLNRWKTGKFFFFIILVESLSTTPYDDNVFAMMIVKKSGWVNFCELLASPSLLA